MATIRSYGEIMGYLVLLLCLVLPFIVKFLYLLLGGQPSSDLPLYITFVMWVSLAALWVIPKLYVELLFQTGHIAKALQMLQQWNQWEKIQGYVKFSLPLHEGFFDFIFKSKTDRPRKLILQALDELIALNTSINKLHNPYVSPHLKLLLNQGKNWCFEALWDSCQRLALVKLQGVERSLIASELDEQNARLRKIIRHAGEARHKYATLTTTVRNANDIALQSAENYFERFYEEARQLKQLEQIHTELIS